MKLTVYYETTDERNRKLVSILRSLGYTVENPRPERITVGELARRVGRRLCTVSMSLKRPSCPPYHCHKGKRRIIWIEPTEPLLSFLTENRKGQRN